MSNLSNFDCPDKLVHLTNPVLGYVRPILLHDDESDRYIVADPQKFPDNGEIFIYGGYGYIQNRFKDSDLFILDDVNHKDNPRGDCWYSANSNSISEIEPTDFIQIIRRSFDLKRRNLPDLKSGNAPIVFFICDNDFLYGPLKFDSNESTWTHLEMVDPIFEGITDEHWSIIENNQGCIFKFRLSDIEEMVVADYIINLTDLLTTKKGQVIYVGAKEETIAWGKKFLHNFSLVKGDEASILNKVTNIELPPLSSDSDRQKFERFKTYLHEINDWVNIEFPNALKSFIETDPGRIYLNKYLDDNANVFFTNYRRLEVESANERLQKINDEIEELGIQKQILQTSIQSTENAIFENISEDEKKVLKEIILNESSRQLLISYYTTNKRLEDISSEVDKKFHEREFYDIDIRRKESELQKLKNQQSSITEAIKKVKDDFFKESEFAQKLFEAKIYTDILNNIDPGVTSGQENLPIKALDAEIKPSSKEFTSEEFVNEIVLRLRAQNRHLQYNEVANLLINLHENFLTIFAGLPGIGKTSLVDKLAKVLGCRDNNRYLSISVQRGWTSSKDLIGYYNPLSRQYQPAKTQLYHYLRTLEKDFKKGTEYPCIVLLDEANLSPVEHYWSDFSGIADRDRQKEINIQDNKSINFGNGLRFIATINYDHTTELLSDRLISRAPVIKLNKPELFLDDNSGDEGFIETFEMRKLADWLRPGKDHFKGDIKNRFDAIVSKLGDDEDVQLGQPIVISPRKYQTIERYCNIAGNVMKGGNQFIGLDFAINQNILPLINGKGESYRRRLAAFQEKLQGLPDSSKHLEKIIQAGDMNFRNYKFFY